MNISTSHPYTNIHTLVGQYQKFLSQSFLFQLEMTGVISVLGEGHSDFHSFGSGLQQISDLIHYLPQYFCDPSMPVSHLLQFLSLFSFKYSKGTMELLGWRLFCRSLKKTQRHFRGVIVALSLLLLLSFLFWELPILFFFPSTNKHSLSGYWVSGAVLSARGTKEGRKLRAYSLMGETICK